MAITPGDFLVSITPSPVEAVLGMTGNLVMSFSNISLFETGYNLSVTVILPDGVSYNSSSIPPTSITAGPSNTIILRWVSIKDLAPNELDYLLNLTVNSDTTFRSTGLPVPIGVPLVTIAMEAAVDTLPRGADDPGNVVITKNANSDLIPLRYNITKSAPGKVPKGAGLLSPLTPPSWPYTYTLTVDNNTPFSSVVSLSDNLPNGVRYLDNLNVSGPDSVALSSPTVTFPSITQDYTSLDWGSVTLSPNSMNIITFDAGIWNNYTVNGVENSGSTILHDTPLVNTATIDGVSGPQTATATTIAKDALIIKAQSPSVVDVGTVINYSIIYEVNQYYNVNNFIITDTIGDGQTYNVGSASIPPTSVTVNPDGSTTIVWELGNLLVNTTSVITYTATVDSNYSGGDPVVTGDILGNVALSNGTNATLLTPTPDRSGTQAQIQFPTITKTVLNYYYADGTVKPQQVASPGDFVEFEIVYDASALTAQQMDVFIDEYAPLNMVTLTDTLPVVYGGTLPGPFAPVTVSPNGLRWYLGTLPANTVWTATFRIQVKNEAFSGTQENLTKLAGYNREGDAYSDRDQATVTFGEPNLELNKTISPPTSIVRPGELYTYSIVVSNPQNLDNTTTDAFSMLLTDVIPTGMTFTGVFSYLGSGDFDPPVFAGQNVSMQINQLAPNQSVTLNYQVQVDTNIPAGVILKNNVILPQPYSQPDLSFQYPGLPLRASVTVNAIGLSIVKTGLPTTALVGDYITYTITITVPEDTIAYTPQFVDTLPIGQSYFGPATVQILPDPFSFVFPTVSTQTVTFPALPDISAVGADVTIIYTFVAEVTSAAQIPPYSETQTNDATVSWAVVQGGPLTLSQTTTFDITVNTPHIDILKEQRNFTQGGSYTTDLIIANPGDVIYYRITVESNGASPAYNVVLSDIISDLSQFGAIISGPTAGTVIPPGPPPSATLYWNTSQIGNGNTETLEFSVTLTQTPGASQQITNNMQGNYDSNFTNPVTYDVASNTVTAQAPALQLNKTVSTPTANVGDTITYVIVLTVPPDVVAYSTVLSDVLPPNQIYANNAKRNFVPVVPTVSGQTVTFPTENVLGPNDSSKVIIYSFKATIISAEPPYPDVQTNNATVNWNVTPQGPAAIPVNASANVLVSPQEPFRGIDISDIRNASNELLGEWEQF